MPLKNWLLRTCSQAIFLGFSCSLPSSSTLELNVDTFSFREHDVPWLSFAMLSCRTTLTATDVCQHQPIKTYQNPFISLFQETPKCLDTVSLVSLWPAMAFRTNPSHDPRPLQLAVFFSAFAAWAWSWWHPWHPRWAGDGNATAVPLGWTDEQTSNGQ